MDPITMMALAQGIPALAQAVTGGLQLGKSQKMLKDLKRPEMEIPESAMQSLAKAKSLGASFDMPGQDKTEMLMDAQLAGAASNVKETGSSTAEMLSALNNLYANRMSSQTQLAGQAAQSYMARQENIQNELNRMADWEQLQFNTNEMQPFMDKAATASALGGGGMQNIYEGIKGAGGAIGGAYMNKMLIDQLAGGSVGMLGSLNTDQQKAYESMTPEQKAELDKRIQEAFGDYTWELENSTD